MILGLFHLPVVSGCCTGSSSSPHLGTHILQHLELRDTSKNTSPPLLYNTPLFVRTSTGPDSTWCLLCPAFALKELHPLLFFNPCGLTEFWCADQTWCLLWCCTKPVFPAHVYVTPAAILMNYPCIKAEIHWGWQCRALLTLLL